MNWLYDHWLAVLFLSLYTLVLLYNAYLGSQASKGLDGYMVGNRAMGGVVVGISFFATFASTNSYIGHAGKGYAYGLPWFTMAILLVLFSWISWRWIGPPLRRFASEWDALTIPDFLGSRFVPEGPTSDRHPLRLAAAIVIVFSSLLYLLAIFKGAGHLFQIFLGIDYEMAVGVTLLIVVLYTSVGGFVSVVRTDAIQGILMLLGSVMMFYFVTRAAGGVSAITELKADPEKSFLFEFNGGIPFAVLLGVSLSGALKLLVDPRQISRFFALKDDAAVKQGIWVAAVGLGIILFCLFPIGIYAQLILQDVGDTDLIVPTLVSDPSIFPFWAADFLIVAIVAAAMSSMDSVLLVAASTLYKNLIAPFSVSAHQLGWTRAAVIGFAIVSAGLALNPPGDIVEITIFSGSLYAVCFFPAVVLGLYWHRGTARSVLWSMSVGTLVLLGWILLGFKQHLHEVFPALAASLAVYYFSARLDPAPPPQTLGN
ncbi:MAG: sodium:solute symporter family protein [Pseudomonadales bacterium]